MANIKIELSQEIIDGQPVTFVAPCDCTAITGIKVYFPGGSKVFTFKDAHGNTLTGLGNLFAAGAYVKAILDVKKGFAYIQNADTNKYIEDTFLKRSGGEMTGTAKFIPKNGTDVIASEGYRNLPSGSPTASYKTRNVVAANGAAMQFYKGTLGEEPTDEVNRLTLTETDTQLYKPLTVSSGGTGATTPIEALANLFALNLNDITDERFMVQSGDDYDNYTTPGAYRIATAAIAESLLNRPSYASAGGRLIVSATSSNSAGRIQIVIFNTANYQIHFRVKTSTGEWGEWDYLKTNNHMSDFVVAEGTSGNWSYRKWNSGVAECWYYKWVTPTALSSAAQVLTKGFTHQITFPFDFVDANSGPEGIPIHVLRTENFCLSNSNGYGVVVRVEHTSASQMRVTWEGSDDVLSTALNICVKGYWK